VAPFSPKKNVASRPCDWGASRPHPPPSIPHLPLFSLPPTTTRTRTQLSAGLFDPPVFQPSKLTVTHLPGSSPSGPAPPAGPRRYTLTHNDVTGALALAVGGDYNGAQLDGWYVRMVRDEVLAEWWFHGDEEGRGGSGEQPSSSSSSSSTLAPGPAAAAAAAAAAARAGAAGESHSLHVFCHVSGQATWLASPGLRAFIFRREMPLVLDAIAAADSLLLASSPALATARVFVHLAASQPNLATTLDYGRLHERDRAAPAWPAWEPWAGWLGAARGVVGSGGGKAEETAPAPPAAASPADDQAEQEEVVETQPPPPTLSPGVAVPVPPPSTPLAAARGAVVAAAARGRASE
jgi:hypothetical protein